MSHSLLEEEIRSLRPAPLPEDLLARMAQPPPAMKPRRARQVLFLVVAGGLAIAAAVTLMVSWHGSPVKPAAVAAAPCVSISEQRSVLLDTRTLAVLHHGGRTWEVAEQRWQDNRLALCSVVPLQLQSTEIRHEIVCQTVEFE